jgi:hypothetical protein
MKQQGKTCIGQNYPNPYNGITTIPFTLEKASNISIKIFDLKANKVAEIVYRALYAGDHSITLNMDSMGIPTANYIYQLEETNKKSASKQWKVMTAR